MPPAPRRGLAAPLETGTEVFSVLYATGGREYGRRGSWLRPWPTRLAYSTRFKEWGVAMKKIVASMFAATAVSVLGCGGPSDEELTQSTDDTLIAGTEEIT